MKGKSVLQKSLIAILIAAMVLTGCAKAETATATAAPAATEATVATEVAATEAATTAAPVEKTVLNVASWWDFSTTQALQDLKAKFEAENPDIELNFVQTASKQYADKMLTTIAGGGDVPDVMMLAMDKLPMFADRGAIMNLDKYYTADLKSQLYDSAITALTYNGSLYAVPRTMTSQVMYLNVAAFKAAGVDYPADNWTWSDFRALSKKLTMVDSSGQNTQWGFYFPKYNDGFYEFLAQNNGDLVSADGTKSMLSDPNSIEALQFLQDMILVDKSVPTESQAQQFGTDDASVFIAGKIGMLVGGVSWMTDFNNDNVEYKIVPLPTGKRAANTSFVNAWTIPTGAKNPDLSWRVLAFFASAEGQQIVLDDNLGMPANKNVDTSKFLAAREDNHYFFDALDNAVPFPTPLHGVDFFNLVEQEFGLMWSGQETVQQAVANVEKTGNDILTGNE
jgi:multiple sugar transport system substrate-binding protein